MADGMRVVIYGSSLSMAGLAASLRDVAGIELLCVDPASPTARRDLVALRPASMLYDLSDPALELDLTLLREQPGLLLIGVHPCSNEALLLSSHPVRALSVADLLGVITHHHRSNHLAGDTTWSDGVPSAH